MSDAAKFQINIETVASGSGAAKSEEDLKKVTQSIKEETAAVEKNTEAKKANIYIDGKNIETGERHPDRLQPSKVDDEPSKWATQEERLLAITKARAEVEAEILAEKKAESLASEQLTELEKSRAGIVSTQLEANQLRAAGQIAEADALEAEVALETRALQLQRVLNIEREEALLLAREDLAAQEQIAAARAAQSVAQTEQAEAGALTGMNLGKARTEATVLARELATGGNYMRSFGALAGSLGPMIGVASVAGFVLYEAFKKHYDEVRKIKEEQEKLTAEIGNTERAYADSVIEARKLKEPTAEWAKALKEANASIDSSTASYKTMIEQQNQVMESQKELDLAKVESQDISPEAKEKKKFDIEVRYAAHRKENADKIYNAEIAQEKQKIANHESAVKAAAEATAAAQTKQLGAERDAVALEEQKKRANYRLEGSKAGELDRMGLRDADAEQRQAALDKIRNERKGLDNWLKSDQLKSDEAAKKAALDKANKEAEQALAHQKAEEEAAASAELTGNQKIIGLQGAKKMASDIYKNKSQTSKLAENRRIEKLEKKDQKDEGKEWAGFMAGPQGGAATQEVIDLAKSAMGSRPTQEGVGRNTYDKITAELKALSAHGNNEKDLAELIKSMSDFAKTASGKIAAQNQLFSEHAAKIRQLEARIRGNSPGAS